MATKIKRCLYVGLGGTGMKSLLYTKKSFVDTYGEVPPMVSFLGIDTDGGAYKKSINSINGEEIKLTPNEQFPIHIEDARSIYEVNKEEFTWIPEKNRDDLDKMTHGAGAIRTNGRFAFTEHYKDLADKVKSAINQITNARLINNDKYELLSTEVEIHIVFSVGGGTGCGTFINMAYLLRNEVPRCKLTAYAVLPEVFEAMLSTGMANVKPNAYGAIYDLDYLMHMGINSKPLELTYRREYAQVINKEPFDAVILIDNKNANGDTYTNIDEIAEMISLALVTSAGELSTATASVVDNLSKEIRKRTRDVENKKAWVAGMGVCEIVYRNSSISEIYATKAAKILIERMFNSCEDTDSIVNAWIDSPEVNIRENNGNDHVIDFIADKRPTHTMESIEGSEPKSAVDLYLDQNQIKDDVLKQKVTELTSRVKTELRKLLVKYINKECGVSTCKGIISGIKAQVDIFIKEMRSEKEELQDKEPKYKTAVNASIDELKKFSSKFFQTKTKREELEEDVRTTAQNLCICQREITRRDAAITIYTAIYQILADVSSKIISIEKNLENAKNLLGSDLSALQNNVGQVTQTFQIDLSQTLSKSLEVKSDEMQVSDFIKTLDIEGKIYNFDDISYNEIKDLILKYTRQLPASKIHKKTTVDDVINKLSEEEFERIVKMAINKSMPLLRYDYQGHGPEEKPSDSYYIGVADKGRSRLCKNEYFKNLVGGKIICDFSNIGNTEKIIIYRIFSVIPPYSIASLKECKLKYDNCRTDCHIDYNWQTRMLREEFDIYPKKSQNDNEIFDFWVKGFIFGLIKNEDGEYMIQSQEYGDALDDYWIGIGEYRDEAYDKFRSYRKSICKEFPDIIEDIVKNKGEEVINNLIKDARMSYYDKYSQINMTKDEVKKRGNERIHQLISDELAYVKKI